MPLSDDTREQIRAYLLGELRRCIQEGIANPSVLGSKPFHARLLPTLFRVPLSERSFSTRLGTWFQIIARHVALQFHQDARNNYLVTGQIQPAADTHINTIVNQMEGPENRRVPNRQADIQQVLAVQAAGGVESRVISDLYVLANDGRELYFEMKTVAPNRDTSKLMKRKILLISALRQGKNAEALAAMAYNPAGDGRPYTEYAHSGHAVQFLELGTDLLVGRDFWQLVGDDQTYDELLEIAEEVGTNAAALIPLD